VQGRPTETEPPWAAAEFANSHQQM